jgi:hypothetical protein
MFVVTVVDSKLRDLFVSVVDVATGLVFDFKANAFAPAPALADAFPKMGAVSGENHKQVRTLYVANGPDPVNSARYVVFFHEAPGGPPVLEPFAVAPIAAPRASTLLVSASLGR